MDAKNSADQSLTGNRRFLALLAGLLLLAGVLWLNRERPQRITRLDRPEAGEKNQEVELEVQLADSGESWSWTGSVAARIYSAAELEDRMETAARYIREQLPREGEALDRVISGVDLVTEVPEADVRVEWSWEDRELLDRNGDVRQDRLSGETLLVLTAQLRCQELTERLDIPICLVPEQLTEAEQQRRAVVEWLDKLAEEEQEEAELILPDQWEDTPLHYTAIIEKNYWLLPLLLACVLLLIRARRQEEAKEQEKDRKEEILLQYPDFVSRFVVLLGAGVNPSSVWMRMAGEYERRMSEGRAEAIYEEACLVARSLRNGEQERQAYEAFGRRTGVQACQRFVMILNQNLRMGTEQILEQLEYEAAQALEERKAQARRRGEEMGTKLLLPMLLQLVLILVMVMVPAFMNM